MSIKGAKNPIEFEPPPTQAIIAATSKLRSVVCRSTSRPTKNEALVVTDNDNLSLAIGKKGSNIKLAARLTHYKIDVKTYDQAKEMGINIYED